MSQKSIELRQKRASLIAEMNDCTEKTAFAGEAQARWKELDEQQKGLQTQIEAIESTENLRAEMTKTDHIERSQPGSMNSAAAPVREDRNKVIAEKRSTKEYNEAFIQHLRTGHVPSELAELRTYTGLDAQSGVGQNLVPTGFQQEIDLKLKAFGGMRAAGCRIVNTSTGNTVNWPTADDTSNTGEWLAEAGTINQLNPTMNQVNLTSNVADSKQVLVSVQLLADSAFDVQGFLSDAFAVRLGRITNAGYTNGNGTGQPKGLLNGVGSTGITNVTLALGANGNNSTSSYNETNSVGTDDLGSLIAQLDPAYRQNAKFMGNQSTFDFLRKVKDGFGRPIWSDSLAAGVPDKIFGYGYQWNQDMSGIAASNNSMVFGDFSHYVIRDVGGITLTVFQELYMASLQKGYVSYLRTDGQLLQPAAFAVLQHRLS